MDTDHKIIGIDLCQESTHLTTSKSSIACELKYIPSVVLPLNSEEKLISGLFALEHRRGKGWEWPPESRINYTTEPGQGAGRVPVISAFGKLAQIEKSQNTQKLEAFEWSPNGVHNSTKASNIIVESCQAFTEDLEGTRILVVPDIFQEISQEKLKRASRNGFKNNPVKFIPRSMALALRWINEYSPTNLENYEVGYLGHIRICSLGLDEWTVQTIGLTVIEHEKKKYLVPVFEPKIAANSLGVWGIAYACLSAVIRSTTFRLIEIWKEVFCGPYIYELLKLPQVFLQNHCSKLWTAPEISLEYRRHKECMEKLPHLNDIPSELLTYYQLLKKVSENWNYQLSQLPKEAQQPLGIITDGCLSSLLCKAGETIGNSLSKADLKIVPDKILDCFSHCNSLSCDGSVYFGQNLLSGLPSYQYTLIPIDIYCQTNSEESLQWIPLIDVGSTLDVGKIDESKKVSGFFLEKGNHEISFILRRPNLENNEYIFRRVPTKFNFVPEKNFPVSLSVKVEPGEGFAVVEVVSQEGKVLAKLDWERMDACGIPLPPPLAYLPKLSVIKSDFDLWEDVKIEFETFEKNKRIGYEAFLKKLLKLLKKVKRNKESLHVSYGPIPSELVGDVNESEIGKLAEMLSALWQDPTKKNGVRDSAFKCLAWLYLSTPDKCKVYISKVLQNCDYQDIKRDALACIGRVVNIETDINIFYYHFLNKLKSNEGKTLNWIYAFNNLTRYREKALLPTVISTQSLLLIALYICEILENEYKKGLCKRTSMSCVRAILHLLYRRKHQKDFLKPDSNEYLRIENILKKIISLATPHSQLVIETTLQFLKAKATEADAVLLYQDDGEEESEEE